jgi:hypothetical protein
MFNDYGALLRGRHLVCTLGCCYEHHSNWLRGI